MSNANHQVDGTPTWAIRRIVEIAVLLPLGAFIIGMMASPALAGLWWYSEVAFAAGTITVVWVGALSGTSLARGVDDPSSSSDESTAEQANESLMVLSALFITTTSMISAHVIGVALITAYIAPMTPAVVVLALPIGLSLADMLISRKTSYSLFVLGFGVAYVILRLVEVAVDVDKGMFTGLGKPVLDLVNLRHRSVVG